MNAVTCDFERGNEDFLQYLLWKTCDLSLDDYDSTIELRLSLIPDVFGF